MGFFGFLKRNELAEIKLLKQQLQKYSAIVEVETAVALKKEELKDLILQKENALNLLIDQKYTEISQKETELQHLITAKEMEYNSTLEIKTSAIQHMQDELDMVNSEYIICT